MQTNPEVFRPNYLVFLLAALWIFFGFGYEVVWNRLTLEINGTITESNEVPAKGAPRYATEYTLKDQNGEITHYTAGPTDASLPRSMPVGTSLNKKRWQLSYERNGQLINDFPMMFYCIMFGIAFGCLVLSLLFWKDKKRSGSLDS